VEITARVTNPDVGNCFIDASLAGTFRAADSTKEWPVEGFCDSEDGSVFRMRFMPPAPGTYKFTVEYHQGSFKKSWSSFVHANEGHRSGPIRLDKAHPWHFVWEGTGKHYFFNGTTAYWLMGWRDDQTIDYSLERLHRLQVNRLRVTIAGRTNLYYGEPVMVDKNFTMYITAWPATSPDRALRFARDRDVIISLVLDMNDGKIHPQAGSDDETRFIQYAINRFSAYSNITWDLGDDLSGYRDDHWMHETGTMIERLDPYHHLATSHASMVEHPEDDRHQDRASDWFAFTSFQEWSRDQHTFMLQQRRLQEQTGRNIPQTNEEYGYEDHYPLWAAGPGSESADALRRTAWEIAMAGAYQTTGESARRGTNVWPDTGGGWMNGRGDDTMTMLVGYAHMVDFFTSFDWWKTDPHDELVNGGDYCLADPGETFAVYLPKAGKVTVQIGGGTYNASWFDPDSGQLIALPPAEGPSWTSPEAPSHHDWALLLQKK